MARESRQYALVKRETTPPTGILQRMAHGWRSVTGGVTVIREMIGRAAMSDPRANLNSARYKVRTVDQTIPDYAFWDHVRRGKARGYSLGSLFAPRIERVLAAWVLGGGIEVKLASKPQESNDAPPEQMRTTNRDYTNAQLAEFVAGLLDTGQDVEGDPDEDDRQSSLLLSLFRDTLGLGDQYVVVNADGSLSVPSVDTVEVERDPLNYKRMLRVTVTTKLDKFTILDEYRADGRTVVVKEGSREVERQEFENLIGRIPVVHVAHGMSGNETNGHPIHEQLLALYDQYDDVLYKQLDGVKLFGNPILALVGLLDVTQAHLDNQPLVAEEYTDQDGNIVERPQIKLDANSILLLGEGGDAKYITPPPGFTEDTKQALKSLFLLLLDATGIPESVWGNELSSARASTDNQMGSFEQEIGGYRNDNGGWIVRLCKIWLQFRALTDPRLVVDKLALTWPEVLGEDKEWLLKALDLAKANGVLTDEQFLTLLDLVENAAAEVEAAQAEAEERQDRMFPEGSTAGFAAQLGQAQRESQNGREPETA